MIFTDRTVIVQKGTSSMNDTIVLYRGDREVEIRFTLNESSPFKFGSGASPNIIEKTEAAYGQLIIKRPNDLPAIFSEIAPTNEGKIIFTITTEMIDEIAEVGNYTFQIRLLDESRNSRATLPEVVNGIEIREPIASEDVSDTNEVGVAAVGYALTTAGTTEDTFDSQGNYNKTTWGTGDRITATKLNKIEAGIEGVNQKIASGGTSGGEVDLTDYAKKADLPTKTSQLTNDSGYITNVPDEYITETELNAKGYATTSQIPTVPTNVSDFTNDANYASETFVSNKIAEAQLGGTESSVDLSGLGADLTLSGQTLKLKNSSGQEIGTGVTLPSDVSGSSITDEEIHSTLASVFGERYIPGVVVDIPCTSLQLTQTSTSLRIGDIISITASPAPSDTTDEIIWSASNDNCTVVDGTVTAVKAGDCIITARCGEQSATCNITVQAAEQPVQPTLSSISAVYTQGDTVVYPDTSLDTLKTSLVVTAHYSDDTQQTVTNYTLNGNLTVGTSTVTVTYEDKTTTFNVTVTTKEEPPTDPEQPVNAILNYDFANVSNSTTVVDLANNNDGILSTACSSNAGGALVLNTASLTSTNNVTLDNDFTITMELSCNNGNGLICSIGDVSNSTGKYFAIKNSYGTIQTMLTDTVAQKYNQINSISGTTYNTENHTIKVTKVGTTMTLYVNDVEQGTTTVTANILPLSEKLRINRELRDGVEKNLNRQITIKKFQIL